MNDVFDRALNTNPNRPRTGQVNLKKQLTLYLKTRGMTAAELSRKSGISKQVISIWLSGTEPRKISQVKKVASVLETSIDNLCFGDGIDLEHERSTDLEALLGDQWISGLFELKFRRVRVQK